MSKFIETYHSFSDKKKLYYVLAAALVLRLCAAIFSGGYAMHDDHFLVVETPSSWAYGFDSGSWFPETQELELEQGMRKELQPQGHSLFYPGVQFAFFSSMKFLGVENPKIQMLINRLMHGLLGVLVVYLSYFLTTMISTKKNALAIAWIAALGWALPFLSVRNLVEVLAIPALLGAVILALKGVHKNAIQLGLLAGLLMAIGVSIRYQTVVFFGVFGLILLVQKHWQLAISIFFGFVVGFFLIQGLPEWIIWGKPFAEMIEYFAYNASDKRHEYAEALGGSTFGIKYFAVLAMLTIPILGAFWFFGFFRQWKKMSILFWPSVAFLVLHMAYENAQERFIFPILHVVLIIGFVGWEAFRTSSIFWQKRSTLWTSITKVSWSLNIILLLFVTTYYGKRARVESTSHLYESEYVEFVIHENTYDGYIPLLPLFYAKQWNRKVNRVEKISEYNNLASFKEKSVGWIYFQGEEELEKRVEQAEMYFPNLEWIGTFEASFLDKIVKKLNPVNRNESILVYEYRASRNN